MGITCAEIKTHPPVILARNRGFYGEVRAVNVKAELCFNNDTATQNPDDFDISMMTQEEADKGFVVLSVVLHDQILTWFLACIQKGKPDY